MRVAGRSDSDPVEDDDGGPTHHALGVVCTYRKRSEVTA
jgi:hypothetical protein